MEAVPLRVEVSLTTGLPSFTVVGLAQSAVREGRERVASALRSSGYGVPNRRITVNLAPADLRKEGTGFDLPIAIGILAASGAVPSEALRDFIVVGELGLDGTLWCVPGVVAAALLARACGRTLLMPEENLAEANLVPGVEAVGVSDLAAAVRALGGERTDEDFVRSRKDTPPQLRGAGREQGVSELPDLADVSGQPLARRALEIAAAGGHNLLFVGPPGVGKTMLAKRMPGILPPLCAEERLEVAAIHSVAGTLPGHGAVSGRPFRAPHHSVSYAGLVGGGRPLRPGEVSLAHQGVLFLDELPEFSRNALEVLRQPMEEGVIRLARADGGVCFPARFMLVAAMNPCPCGYAGDGSDRCRCDPGVVARYRGRISGPLLDRIDLHVEMTAADRAGDVAAVVASDLDSGWVASESSAVVAERVRAARERHRERYAPAERSHMTSRGDGLWPGWQSGITREARLLLEALTVRFSLSMRARHRVFRVARTVADLDHAVEVHESHVAEAAQYRAASVR